jgi:glutathione S-transferase
MEVKNRKVYGSLKCSPNTLKVLAFLFEHDLQFEFVPINLDAGEHKKQPFISLNPFGEVPVYEEADIKLFETRAIIRGMGHQYAHKKQPGEELICWNAKAQAVVSNWIDVEDHIFEPLVMKIVSELVNKPENGLTPDEAAVAEAKAELANVLDVYEAWLIKSNYLPSNKFTIVDLLHLPNLQALVDIPETKKMIESRPRVSKWCGEILARPAWVKVIDMQQNA